MHTPGLLVSNNTVYAPNGEVSITCGGKTVDMKAFQKMGYDGMTTVSGNMPSADTIVGWAKTILGGGRL